MNYPPTAVGGIPGAPKCRFLRPSMNYPPTAVGGISDFLGKSTIHTVVLFSASNLSSQHRVHRRRHNQRQRQRHR
jgi:hypothetical protein